MSNLLLKTFHCFSERADILQLGGRCQTVAEIEDMTGSTTHRFQHFFSFRRDDFWSGFGDQHGR